MNNILYPISWDFHPKTPSLNRLKPSDIALRALAIADEYLYLGKLPRIKISVPENRAEITYLERRRSKINRFFKAISYCTIVLPIAALTSKVALRYFLGVHSMKIHFTANSKLDNLDMGIEILSFLEAKDRASYAQTAIFARDQVRHRDLLYKELTTELKQQTELLCKETIDEKIFLSLLADVALSSASGDQKYWVVILDKLVSYAPLINHDVIVESLNQISSSKMYHFCDSLCRKALSRSSPWIACQTIQKYFAANQAGAEKALRKHLEINAKALIKKPLMEIDAGMWFGGVPNANHELNREKSPLRIILEDVFLTHLRSLNAHEVRIAKSGVPEAFIQHLSSIFQKYNIQIVRYDKIFGPSF